MMVQKNRYTYQRKHREGEQMNEQQNTGLPLLYSNYMKTCRILGVTGGVILILSLLLNELLGFEGVQNLVLLVGLLHRVLQLSVAEYGVSDDVYLVNLDFLLLVAALSGGLLKSHVLLYFIMIKL